MCRLRYQTTYACKDHLRWGHTRVIVAEGTVVDPLALMSNVSPQHYHSQSSTNPLITYHQPYSANTSQSDLGLSPTDNLIENLTNTLALLTQSYKTFLPQTNNQLKNLIEPKESVRTVGYGRAQNRVGNANPGQARQVKCYNCNGVCHITRNCTQPKHVQELESILQRQDVADASSREWDMLSRGIVFQADDCDAYDSDVDEAPTAQTMFMANLSSADPVRDEAEVFYVASHSELNVSRFTEMQKTHDVVKTRCLELEAELSNLRDNVRKDNYNELLNRFSNLEVNHLNLQLKYQNLKDSFQNKPSSSVNDTPDFNSVFVIGQMKASLQGKDNVIHKLKMQISQFQETRSELDRPLDLRARDSQISQLTEKVNSLQDQNELVWAENAKIKQHYKELYDSIKITRAKHTEQTTALKSENESLKVQIQNTVSCVTTTQFKPKVTAPGKYALDVEPIPPRNRNNREVHLVYLRHLKESVDTLRDIVEEAKAERPLDRSLEFACRYTKHSQELLEYVFGTCPKVFNQQDKKHATTPRKKQVAFEDQIATSSSTTHKHVEPRYTQKSNVPVPPSTGVSSCTDASGSQPRSILKKHRIPPAKSDSLKKVEDHSRIIRSSLRTTNRVDSSISSKRTVINSHSHSVCQTCNKCLFSANHDMCVVTYLNSVNASPNVKIVVRHVKQVWKPKQVTQVWKPKHIKQIWKPTGKTRNNVGYQWRPTGRTFTLSRTNRPLVFGLRLLKTYDGGSLKAHEFREKGILEVNSLQEQNELFRAENAKIKQHYKELYDSIKISRAKHTEQTTALKSENESLKVQIQNTVSYVTTTQFKPKVTAPGKYALDVEPIPPRNRNNREVHLVYLRHLKESVDTLRDIVEEAKAERPLDRSLEFACRYTKHSQELLEYVFGTCPKVFNQQDKKHATTPRKRQVAFEDQSATSSSTTHKHVEPRYTQKSNVPVPPSTGVSSCTDASGSQPRSILKKHRIPPAKSDSLKKVEDHSRIIRSSLRTTNRVDSSISSKRTVVQIVLWYLDSGCSKHMTGDRSRLRNFVKKFIGTVRFGNDHFGAIMGYGDYVIGDSVISRVYYVEGLGHNLFSVGQFCDSDLEVAFRKHSCYVRDTDGVELLKGSRGSNLYTDEILKN
ncbi:hypothetical protein Tco_0680840 [Tanacetum coccineum]|uniref:Retrovirus-related Pol polyprotein from transposon TNT 1-94-like beta-barrel domain-containing protein n=1 Tax=Tanacetum coccineum TaxID=301880 RepID=A0ABQ4XML5_9ASTR